MIRNSWIDSGIFYPGSCGEDAFADGTAEGIPLLGLRQSAAALVCEPSEAKGAGQAGSRCW